LQKNLKSKLFIKIIIISNPNKPADAPNDLILDDKKNNIKVLKITRSPPSIIDFNFSFLYLKEKTIKQTKITKNTKRNGNAKPKLGV
tara:strand:+ start:6057 stop:6317 length:261 start_codon:yes stop_codon:yes gene_type:complete